MNISKSVIDILLLLSIIITVVIIGAYFLTRENLMHNNRVESIRSEQLGLLFELKPELFDYSEIDPAISETDGEGGTIVETATIESTGFYRGTITEITEVGQIATYDTYPENPLAEYALDLMLQREDGNQYPARLTYIEGFNSMLTRTCSSGGVCPAFGRYQDPEFEQKDQFFTFTPFEELQIGDELVIEQAVIMYPQDGNPYGNVVNNYTVYLTRR